MSFLDKLLRNEQNLDLRGTIEEATRSRAQADEHENENGDRDNNAAGRLARIALGGHKSPVHLDINKSGVGVELGNTRVGVNVEREKETEEKDTEEQANENTNDKGKRHHRKLKVQGTVDSNVNGVDVHGEVNRSSNGAVDTKGSVGVTRGPITAEAEVSRDKDGKVETTGRAKYEKGNTTAQAEATRGADGKVNANANVDVDGPVKAHGEVTGKNVTSKDRVVDANATVDVDGPVKAHGEVDGKNLTSKDREVDANANASFDKGPLKAKAEVTGENLTSDERKIGVEATADAKAGKYASGHAEAKSEDITRDPRIHGEANGHIGKHEAHTETDDLLGAIASPFQKLAKVAVNTVENALGGGEEKAPEAADGKLAAANKGGALDVDGAAVQAKGEGAASAKAGANATGPAATAETAPVAVAASAPTPEVSAKPDPKLGSGGKRVVAKGTATHGKNAVGRWGANLDSLDIGPDPEMVRPDVGPAALDQANAAPDVEVGVPGVTLPKMTPRGPRPKVEARKGHGDWHTAQREHALHTKGRIGERRDDASSHGEQLSGDAGGMMKSALDHDHQAGSSLTAKANQPPQLVARRGRQPNRKAAQAPKAQPVPQQKPQTPAEQQANAAQVAKMRAPVDVTTNAEQQGEDVDNLVAAATNQAENMAASVLDAAGSATKNGNLDVGELIRAVADPGTRNRAAAATALPGQKNAALGRLDAVNAVGPVQARQFAEHMRSHTHEHANQISAEAENVGGDTHKKPVGLAGAATPTMHPDVIAPTAVTSGDISPSFITANDHDVASLRQIQADALRDLGFQGRPQQPATALQHQEAVHAEPRAMPQEVAPPEQDVAPTTGPQPQPQAQPGTNPQEVAHRANAQAQRVASSQAARTAQNTTHARNREQEAQQRAAARKKQADADKKAREQQVQAELPAQKAKLKAELDEHANLATQVLTMNKEQLAAEYDKRLKTDTEALQKEINESKVSVKDTWEKQRPLAQEANKQAKLDIDKFCDGEKKHIDADLKKLEGQLKTNKEQAAKTAEEQGKDDCDRYADTRESNIEKIKASAESAAADQRKLGQEAFNIAMARADRATDDKAKEAARNDANAEKSRYEGLANKAIADGNTRAGEEKKKYDDLIAKRTLSYQTTAKNIREKGVGYLDELKKSFEQAKLDIETLRNESKKQADDRLAVDMQTITRMVDEEMQRLDLQLQDRVHAIQQEIKYALASMANLTEDQKAKMRADIQKAHDEACARIDKATADEMGAMQLQLADCHSRIDATLGQIGSHTAAAVRQLSSFKQSFSEQVQSTTSMVNDRSVAAVTAQKQIASTVSTTASKIRSGAMDSVSGQSATDLGKRDVWTDWNKEKADFAKLQADDRAANEQRQKDLHTLGDVNRQKATDRKLDASKRAVLDATGGWGVNPDTGAVMREMAKLSPEEVAQLMKDPEIKKRLEGLTHDSWSDWVTNPLGTALTGMPSSDLKRLQDLGNSATPEEMKAKIIDWSFNGGKLGGAGYDDKTFKEVMSGMSPEQRAEIDKNYKAQTGKSIDTEIDQEAWGSSQNNRLMHANMKSDAAAIAEEKWQAAEGGFFRGVKDIVDAVPGGRILVDPAGELMRGVGPMFGFKAPDSALDQLAGYGMNQDAYIKQTDRIRELTEPPPGASAAEVSAYMQKRRDMMREIDGWLGANHQGLSLEKMDNAEAKSEYNQFWMKDGDNTTFRNMLDAGRTGDWAKYSNNKAAYGAETTLGNRNWLKEEIDHRTQRGDMKGLREFLATRGPDGTYESFVDANMSQKVDRGYFKSIGQDPPPEKGSKAWREMMANKLLYAQFGGRTGWGDDREEMAKVIGSLSKEELDAVRADYSRLSSEYGLSMDNTSNQVQMATNPLGFFFLGNWSSGNLDQDVYLSNSGYMSDLSGGVIGKGRDYAMMEYDLKHGKPTTPEQMMAREKFKRDFDMNSGLLNELRQAGIWDSRGVQGEHADKEYAELVATYEKLKAAGVADMKLDDPRVLALSPDQIYNLARFNELKDSSEAWAKSANAESRAFVDGVVTVVTTTVTIITTVAITVVTAGTATPFIVAALAAAGGAALTGLAGMGVKAVMLGNAYGGGEAKMDFANLVIDSIVAGVTAGTGIEKFAGNIVGKLGIGTELAQKTLENLIKNAITSGADLTKFLLDENLYKGSPEEVLARIRTKSMQMLGTTVASTALSATKFDHSVTQAAVQSAVSYDPSQPAGGQFLAFLQNAGSGLAGELATQYGTHISEEHWGKGGAFGPNKGAPEPSGDASPTPKPDNDKPLPTPESKGMRVRDDGVVEVTSPEFGAYLREQIANGKATIGEGNPPKIHFETTNGIKQIVLADGGEQPVKPAKTEATAKTEPEKETVAAPVKELVAANDNETTPITPDKIVAVGGDNTNGPITPDKIVSVGGDNTNGPITPDKIVSVGGENTNGPITPDKIVPVGDEKTVAASNTNETNGTNNETPQLKLLEGPKAEDLPPLLPPAELPKLLPPHEEPKLLTGPKTEPELKLLEGPKAEDLPPLLPPHEEPKLLTGPKTEEPKLLTGPTTEEQKLLPPHEEPKLLTGPKTEEQKLLPPHVDEPTSKTPKIEDHTPEERAAIDAILKDLTDGVPISYKKDHALASNADPNAIEALQRTRTAPELTEAQRKQFEQIVRERMATEGVKNLDGIVRDARAEVTKGTKAEAVTPEVAAANQKRAAEARKITEQWSEQLAKLIPTGPGKFIEVKRVTLGDGTAGVLSHSTQKTAEGATPKHFDEHGNLVSVPDAIAIGNSLGDQWSRHEDHSMGQAAGHYNSEGYAVNPSEFNSDTVGLAKASDVANANVLTAKEKGMATLRDGVAKVETRENSTGPWEGNGKIRITTESGRVIYTDEFVHAGGLGTPRKDALSESEKFLGNKFSYAENDQLPPGLKGAAPGVAMVTGSGPTSGWSMLRALEAGHEVINIRDPKYPGVPGIEGFPDNLSARLQKYIDEGRLKFVTENITAQNELPNGKLEVLTADGGKHVIDGAVVASGSVLALPTGGGLSGKDVGYRPVIREVTMPNGKTEPRIVGLEGFDRKTGKPNGIKVEGAAMTTGAFTKGDIFIASPESGAIPTDSDQWATTYSKHIDRQAADGPGESSGVAPSIYQSANNIPAGNRPLKDGENTTLPDLPVTPSTSTTPVDTKTVATGGTTTTTTDTEVHSTDKPVTESETDPDEKIG